MNNNPGTSGLIASRYEWAAFGGRIGAPIDGIYNDDQFLERTNSQVSVHAPPRWLGATVAYHWE